MRAGDRVHIKAQNKVAKLHEHIHNKHKDFHFKLAHQLCDGVGMVFAENLNVKGLSRRMVGKHCLDASFGQFLTILEWVCWKSGVYFAKVDPRGTSQICPNCQHHTGKKELSERVHHGDECGYTTDRDVAAAQIVDQRGLAAVGYTVKLLGEGLSISSPLTQESPTL